MPGESLGTEGGSQQQGFDRVELRLLPDLSLRLGSFECLPPLRAQRLLVLLAISGRRLPRAWIARTLWPDSDPVRALTCLRSTLQQLRQVDALRVVYDEPGLLALDRSVTVDWTLAGDLADRLIAGGVEVPNPLHAVALLKHPLLRSWDEGWLSAEQERFEEVRAQALEALSRLLLTRGSFAFASRTAALSVSASRFRESAYEALIAAQTSEGNRAAAIATFRGLSRLLREELGVEPSFTFNGF